jgi:hypothetical protein
MVEPAAHNGLVGGSNPSGPTILFNLPYCNIVMLKLCRTRVGEWRRLVAHLVWDQGVAGSNPVSPTIFVMKMRHLLIPVKAALTINFSYLLQS